MPEFTPPMPDRSNTKTEPFLDQADILAERISHFCVVRQDVKKQLAKPYALEACTRALAKDPESVLALKTEIEDMNLPWANEILSQAEAKQKELKKNGE